MSGRMLSTYGATALAHGPTHLGKDKGTPRSPDNFSSCLRKANVGAMTHKCHKSLPNELSKVRQELWRAQCLICVFTLSKPQRKQLSSVQFQSIRLFSIGISWVYHGCVIAGGIVASPCSQASSLRLNGQLLVHQRQVVPRGCAYPKLTVWRSNVANPKINSFRGG